MVKASFTSEIPSDASDPVIEKWDWSAVKNTLDDSVRKFLVSQNGLKEDNTLMDIRLVISTLAVLISAYALLYDWYNPFPKSRDMLIISVLVYFSLIAILTVYTSYVEKNCFVVVKQNQPSGSAVWKCSSIQKPPKEHVYTLEVVYKSDAKKPQKCVTHELFVAKYFDENGLLLTKSLNTDLCKFFSSLSDEKKKN